LKVVKNSLSQESSVFLNLIRFAACEMVVLCHFLTKYQPVFGEASFRLGSTLGGVAVLLFFALSGMLICYSLLKKLGNPTYRFRDFFVDRFSRIYSGLVPSMLFSAFFAALIYFTNYPYFDYLSSMQSSPSLLTFVMTLGMLQRFPISFFNSLLSPLGLVFPLPSVTPFGFNGLLWTLAVEWWIYMFFGWFAIGLSAFLAKRKRSSAYKILFLIIAAALSFILIGLMQEFSSVIIVWFVGALMMLAVSNETLRSKLVDRFAARVLALVFVFAFASAIFGAYVAFAWTGGYYDVFLGLALSAFVLFGVLFLNGNGVGYISKCVLNERLASWIAVGAGFSYTLFLTHYPIVIFLNGLNLPIDRLLMLPAILLITNLAAFSIAYFTEKRHRYLAEAIKKHLHLGQR
jgi:peptidoglycan/LPS O-acetylase OafA/YrhL